MVSVVIPTKNAGPSFKGTLDAIKAQKLDDELEIVVVDSGSTDGTVELCRRYSVRIFRINPYEFNHGLTRNLGIEMSRGDLVAMIVQDAIPADENWLSSMVEAVRSDSSVAGAYSRHVCHPGVNLFIKYRVEYGFLGRNKGRIVQSANSVPNERKLSTDDLYVQYAFNDVSSMIRKEIWTKHPLKPMSFAEDLEWAKRVMDAGYKIIYEPRSVVYHSHQRGLADEFKRSYVTRKVMNELLGGERAPFSFGIMVREFKGFYVFARHFISKKEAARLSERISSAVYAFTHKVGWYLGLTLANKSEGLVKHGWYRFIETRITRGL